MAYLKGPIMPNLGYTDYMAPKVESGEKRQTIRAIRKRPIKKGQTLFHWERSRRPDQRKILESECKSAEPIVIDKKCAVFVNGRRLTDREREYLAYQDGFRPLGRAWEEMKRFFENAHGFPFEGQLIKW